MRSVDEVGVDVRGGNGAVAVENCFYLTRRRGEAEAAEVSWGLGRSPSYQIFSALSVSLRLCVRLFLRVKPHDDAMDVRLVKCLGVPPERAPGEIYLHAPIQQMRPERGNGYALANRVRCDKGRSGIQDSHEVSCFLEPTGDIIKIAIVLYAVEHGSHVVLLLLRLKTLAAKRRVADHINLTGWLIDSSRRRLVYFST